MKGVIKNIQLFSVVSSISKPIADATHSISDIRFYVVQVTTAEGVTGQGYLLSFHYAPNGVRGVLQDMRDFVLGREYTVNQTVQLALDMEAEQEYFGNKGLQRWARAAINVAMWDAWAKMLDQPVWRLLGCHNKKIPVYGSGGWLSYSEQELLEEVLDYKRRGFRAVKIKVGSPEVEEDLARLYKVREAVGNSLNIMMDANQGMDVSGAIRLSSMAKDIGIQWFEEPVPNTNFAGYETIRSKTGISLAMGEREYDTTALKELMRRNALDLWQPDLLRIGGVEEWRESAYLANAYQVPCLPHYYKDYDVPLLATVPNAYGAESFDWIDGSIDNQMVIEEGFAHLRQGAGWGFSFLEKNLTSID